MGNEAKDTEVGQSGRERDIFQPQPSCSPTVKVIFSMPTPQKQYRFPCHLQSLPV